MAVVDIRNVSVSYGDNLILDSVSLKLEGGEFVAVLGPSGCGKTTLLRVIAGFAEYQGTVEIDGRACDAIPPHRRNIGIVFQDYALFPHKTVGENVAFGLRLRKMPRAAADAKVEDLLALLQLKQFRDRYPSQLSGGQRQRVAIARALAVNPQVLLLDEPLSALDKKLREEMQVELRQLQQRVGITTMFVTHDQEEALALADKIVVMDRGRICQIDSPSEVYNRPVNHFVANFIGKSNIFEASVKDADGGVLLCQLPGGTVIRVSSGGRLVPKDGMIHFFVRPERIKLSDAGSANDASRIFSGVVRHVVYLGAHQNVHIALETGQNIEAQLLQDRSWKAGDPVAVHWRPEDAMLLSG